MDSKATSKFKFNLKGKSSDLSIHDSSSQPDVSLLVGGTIQTPAYCLLDGMVQGKRVQFLITTLPVLLGRTPSFDPQIENIPSNFVGLGKLKALSRPHLKVEFRAKTGVFFLGNKNGDCIYKPERMKHPSNYLGHSGGFYVITCLGKNAVRVNGQLLKQSEQAVIDANSTIWMGNSFRLYFLLPRQESKTTVQIPLRRKRNIVPFSMDTAINSSVIEKKSKLSQKKDSTKLSSSSPISNGGSRQILYTEIESMTTKQLLQELHQESERDSWDRRHQLIGSTVSFRAVLDCAQDERIVNLSLKNGGVARTDIMKWIEESPTYSSWVHLMRQKLEDKSYQASITKALIRAGFLRTAMNGRYIKWRLPSNSGQYDMLKPAHTSGNASSATPDVADAHFHENISDVDDDGIND